jgi:PIN domain nuclease of toxin-antitoxin system
LGVTALPRLHRDPFDRSMIAQAVAENLVSNVTTA